MGILSFRRIAQLVALLVVFAIGIAVGTWQTRVSYAHHERALQAAAEYRIRDAMDQFQADQFQKRSEAPTVRRP